MKGQGNSSNANNVLEFSTMYFEITIFFPFFPFQFVILKRRFYQFQQQKLKKGTLIILKDFFIRTLEKTVFFHCLDW